MRFVDTIIRNLPRLLDGLWLTLEVSGVALALAVSLGLLVAYGRMSQILPVRWAATAYIEFLRNTPLLHYLFLVFFGLPAFGVRISGFEAAVLGLSAFHIAYMAEVYRSGIESISRTQREAGKALGMSNLQIARLVVLPQALIVSIPLIVSQFTLLVKDSSLAATIGVYELTLQGRIIAERTAADYEVFVAIALFYLAITSLLGLVAAYLEVRLRFVS